MYNYHPFYSVIDFILICFLFTFFFSRQDSNLETGTEYEITLVGQFDDHEHQVSFIFNFLSIIIPHILQEYWRIILITSLVTVAVLELEASTQHGDPLTLFSQKELFLMLIIVQILTNCHKKLILTEEKKMNGIFVQFSPI